MHGSRTPYPSSSRTELPTLKAERVKLIPLDTSEESTALSKELERAKAAGVDPDKLASIEAQAENLRMDWTLFDRPGQYQDLRYQVTALTKAAQAR